MKLKRRLIWRAAMLLLALAVVTGSLTLARAKYIEPDLALDGTFEVYSIVSTDSGPISVPAGTVAFYARGQKGGDSVANNGGNNVGGDGGQVRGIYKNSDGETLRSGSVSGGAGSGNGGSGGACWYILKDSAAALPAQVNSGEPAGLLVVAGGGGGAGTRSNNVDYSYPGGHAGASGSGGADAPVDGVPGNYPGRSGGGQVYAPDRHDNINGGGGGGIGPNNNTGTGWQGGWGGRDRTNNLLTGGGWDSSYAPGGSWFHGGSSAGDWAAGGGAGLFGGGAGGRGRAGIFNGYQPDGAGGGGSSFLAAPGVSPTTGYTAVTDYETAAWNYFNTRVAAIDAAGQGAVAVWLGP